MRRRQAIPNTGTGEGGEKERESQHGPSKLTCEAGVTSSDRLGQDQEEHDSKASKCYIKGPRKTSMRHISSVKHIPLDISLLVSSTSSFPSEDSLSSSLTALVPALVVFVALRLTMIRLLAHVTQSLCYEFQCS